MKYSNGFTLEEIINAGNKAKACLPIELFQPDFLGIMHLDNLKKKNPITSGYRPTHLIKEGYLTSGQHMYYQNDCLLPGDCADVYVKLVTPESYPFTLSENSELKVTEGINEIGNIKIIEIFNPILNTANKSNQNGQ